MGVWLFYIEGKMKEKSGDSEIASFLLNFLFLIGICT